MSYFFNYMKRVVMSVSFCLTTFTKKTIVYYSLILENLKNRLKTFPKCYKKFSQPVFIKKTRDEQSSRPSDILSGHHLLLLFDTFLWQSLSEMSLGAGAGGGVKYGGVRAPKIGHSNAIQITVLHYMEEGSCKIFSFDDPPPIFCPLFMYTCSRRTAHCLLSFITFLDLTKTSQSYFL